MIETNIETRGARRGWLVPTLLILLSLVPVGGGLFRLFQLGTGAEVTADNARFFDAPVPIVLHLLGATAFALLGAFQFSPGLRRRRPRWHRFAGSLLIPSGIIVAATGLWMQAFYRLPDYDGKLLAVFRYFFGSAMLLSILLGVRALLRRDFVRHGAWMMRAYAIGMGAGTQVLILGPWYALAGPPDKLVRGVFMGAAWILNVGVAEWVLRRARRAQDHARGDVVLSVESEASAAGAPG